MKISLFSSKRYDEQFFKSANVHGAEIEFIPVRFNAQTAILAKDADVVCCFVNDVIDESALEVLSTLNVKLIALRCAGFNNVDLEACKAKGIGVCRVPEYSPYAVAEHAVALILNLNRNIHRAHNRVRENDYSLDGLLGFDLHGKTVGLVGAGKIGQVFASIMLGFGCKVLIYDPKATLHMEGVEQVELSQLFLASDIISLHCPLVNETHHMINDASLAAMKKGVMIINTSRGGLIDTVSVIKALKSGHLGYLGLDVYEEEGDLFFEDFSNDLLQDDVFARLQTFPNVIVTSHQGFFTKEALERIAEVTLNNIEAFGRGEHEKVKWVNG